MASLLKDVYSPSFYNALNYTLTAVVPGFDQKKFIQLIFTESFGQMELKQRMRHTVRVLHEFMPGDYKMSVQIILKLVELAKAQVNKEDGLAYMFLPDYIEVYGLDEYETSVEAMEVITQFVSCEFSVRPFLLRYFDRMMAQMLEWTKHDSFKVRRLASEGCRPRLPWAMAVPALKKDPTPVLAVLENLKADQSEWVRRSVANNLNDIAKDHPAVVLDIVRRWSGVSKDTDAILKHGSRTLLKQGQTDILSHYGLNGKDVSFSDFEVITPVVTVGDSLSFSFSVSNTLPEEQKVRLEYAIFYKMKNGQLSKKVFKISERVYQPYEQSIINRKHRFVPITTRKYYPGSHRVSLIVNGEEKTMGDFELVEQ